MEQEHSEADYCETCGEFECEDCYAFDLLTLVVDQVLDTPLRRV